MAQQTPQPISRQLGKETRSASAGNAVFRGVLSQDVDWKALGAFPPSARLAVVVGQPSQPGPYTVRVKVTQGVKLMPHRHPEDRICTVISGVFYIGLGGEFDSDKLEAYPFCPATHRISTGRNPANTHVSVGEWAARRGICQLMSIRRTIRWNENSATSQMTGLSTMTDIVKPQIFEYRIETYTLRFWRNDKL